MRPSAKTPGVRYGDCQFEIESMYVSTKQPLDRPINRCAGDQRRRRNDNAAAVPGAIGAIPSDEHESHADHCQLPYLYPYVEHQQCCHKLRAWQSKFLKRSRETHAMQKPEDENNDHSPGLQL